MEGSRPRSLVTGASGMLGSHLVEVLLAAGVEVRALVRRSSSVRHLESLPVEIIRAESDEAEAIRRAMRGVDFVFHTAGRLSVSAPLEAGSGDRLYQEINVGFTGTLLAASAAADVRRFVYASSTAVYGVPDESPVREDAPLRPIGDYGLSKLRAEELVRAHQARGLPTTIVRPCILYGPRDRYFTRTALRLARLPILPLIEGGRYLVDLACVLDVAELMWAAARSEPAVGRVYNAGPGVPVSLRDLIETYRRLTGRGPRIVPVSANALRKSTRWARWALALAAPGTEGLLSEAGLDYLTRDLHLDMTRARAELGYTPRFSLAEGLALTLAKGS